MTPAERAEAFAVRFRSQANHLAFAYGGPVYLVGSYLHAAMPGDIDIRCLVAREDLELWFGEDFDNHRSGMDWTTSALARHREELKQSRRMTRRWKPGDVTRLRIDFQFQTALFSEVDGLPIQDDRPRIRLDAVPLVMLTAGRGDP